MQDKTKLGTRYTCFQCGCKFYDLNRPVALCPDCQADQAEAPVRDVKSLLSSGRRHYETSDAEDEEEEEDADDALDGLDDGLGDDDDDDDEQDDDMMGGGYDDED